MSGRVVRIKPGVIALVALLTLALYLAAPLYDAWAGSFDGPARTGASGLFAVGFAVVYVLGIVAHEAGHVLAARLYGGRLRYVSIGLAIGVNVHVPGGRTSRHQAVISAAGPAGQALAGTAIGALTYAGGEWTLGALVAAVIVVGEAAANLVVPWPRSNDAGKLYRSLWHIARGRASQAFAA